MERAWAERIVKLVETLTYNYTLDIKSTNPPIVSENNRGTSVNISSRWNVADERLYKHTRNMKKDIGEGFNPYPNIAMLP